MCHSTLIKGIPENFSNKKEHSKHTKMAKYLHLVEVSKILQALENSKTYEIELVLFKSTSL